MGILYFPIAEILLEQFREKIRVLPRDLGPAIALASALRAFEGEIGKQFGIVEYLLQFCRQIVFAVLKYHATVASGLAVGFGIQIQHRIARRHGLHQSGMNATNLAAEDEAGSVLLQLPISIAIDGAGENHALARQRAQALLTEGVIGMTAPHDQGPRELSHCIGAD